MKRTVAGLLILVGCASPPSTPPPSPTGPPAADALACAPFPFAPPEVAEATEATQRARPPVVRCAASEVVDGVAVEKAWIYPAVEYTLLLQGDGGWTRWPLGHARCGGEVPAGCSHDEMFRRTWDVVRDGDRIALYAPPSGPLNPRVSEGNQTQAYGVIVVPDADPYSWFVRPSPGNVHALIRDLPATLADAYRATLSRGTPVTHATQAFDAGNPAPREILRPLIPREDCDGAPGAQILQAFEERWDDPWTTDGVGPWYCLREPTAQDTLELGEDCRAAIAVCGLDVPATLPVSIFDGRADNRDRGEMMVVPSDSPAALLGPELVQMAPVHAGPLVFAATRNTNTMGMLHSRTGVVWLGPEEVRVHRIHAPVSVAPRSPEGSDWTYPEGTRWCFIPLDACPIPRAMGVSAAP